MSAFVAYLLGVATPFALYGLYEIGLSIPDHVKVIGNRYVDEVVAVPRFAFVRARWWFGVCVGGQRIGWWRTHPSDRREVWWPRQPLMGPGWPARFRVIGRTR